jgi:dTDP-4-amino-4,6-dideoxygalactose transaminase
VTGGTTSAQAQGPGGGGMIPVCDLAAQFRTLEPDLREAMERVLARSWFILGEEGRCFEEEFARALGVPFAAGVGSGTDAIHLALRAAGIGPGDAVLTAVNSAVPTAAAICAAGALPCFADVDPLTGLLDPDSAAEHLTPRVKAIIPVHLYGRCAPMDPILDLAAKASIPVVEDAAQAHGATWHGRPAGGMSLIGCFSFYPSKNLGAYGDAGACVTADPECDRSLRRLRNYGEADRYHSISLGFNSRLDEIQAAVLRVKLTRLREWNARRREIAREYRNRLRGLPLLLPPSPEEAPVFADAPDSEVQHLFVIQVARRDRFREEMARLGVGTQVHYPLPIHLHPAYAHLGLGPGSFPKAERRARHIVSLPMYPELTPGQIEHVVWAAEQALRGEVHPEELPC